MILHSTAVQKACEDYSKAVPEVFLRYAEYEYGIIVFVPKNFDLIPPLTRAVAYAEIEKLMIRLKLLQTNPRIEVGSHFV